MGCCMDGMCARCHAAKKVVLGALVLLNAFVWPLWTDLTGWLAFFGALMVVGGVVKLVKPHCGHCAGVCEMPAGKKRR